MNSITETAKIARLGLLTAASVIIYLQIGIWIDVILPLVGCILRPMIVVFILTSFFHLQSIEIIAPTLFGSAMYAFFVSCPFGWISLLFVPASLLYAVIYTNLRNKIGPELNFLISGAGAGALYLIFITLLLPTQFTDVIKYTPVILVLAFALGLIQRFSGRVKCNKCSGCD